MEAMIEGSVLAVAGVLVVRVLLKPPIRRELRAHPLLAVVLFSGAGFAAAFLTWAWLHSDAVGRVVAAVLGAGVVLAMVRARPGYGRFRGLPAGSLGLATSLDAIDDPDFYARSAERWGPIFKMSQVHHPVVCITDLAMGLEFLRAESDALVQSDWPFSRLVPGGYVEFMNGEPHARYRAMLAAGFTAEVLEECRGSITAVIRQQLAELARSGNGRGVDPEVFLYRIGFASLLRVVLGIAVDSAQVEALRGLFADLNRPFDIFLPTPGRVETAYRRLAAIVAELAAAARRPGSGSRPTGSVLAQVVAADPTRADDDTMIGNLILMVKDGSNMVRGLLRWLLKMNADDPRWAEQFRNVAEMNPEDPARVDGLASGFVNETLRLHGSRYVYRRLVRDARLGRYRLPKGWLVRLCLGEAHERPDRFPDPKRFDPARFAEGCPDRTQFCPFGDGAHACFGADLAVEVATAFVREVALGYEVGVVEDGPAWRINRHWGLWRPNPRFRVAIAARTRSGVAGSWPIQTPQPS
jgi:cytochrome P450